jgi:hypothetical protein
MAFKTFYTDFEKYEFVKKKVFSKYIYPKHFVRSDSNGSNVVEVIDDHTNFISLGMYDSKPGISFFSTRFFFKYKKNTILKFHSFLNFKISSNNTLITLKLYEALQLIFTSKCLLRLMLVLNPVKGGFNAYSCGFLGFLPRSQGELIFKKVLVKSLRKKVSLSNFFFLPIKNHFVKNFLSISIPIYLTNTVIYSCCRTPNFSSNISYRKSIFFENFVNFVFLVKKRKKKNLLNYENSIFEKRSKNSYYKNKLTKKFPLHNKKPIKKSR